MLRIIHIYETQTARLLEATAAIGRGTCALPRSQAGVEPDPRGTIPAVAPAAPGDAAGDSASWRAEARVGVYLEVRAGGIHVTALPDAGHVSAAVHCSAIDISSQTIEHYWHVDCDGLTGVEAIQLSVAATGKDATVVVRDYYPMFTTVRVAS